jgi:osmotically-inducible protein OsmY
MSSSLHGDPGLIPWKADSTGHCDAIEAEAEACLRNSPYFSLHRVTCRFQDGVLTLRGCVPKFYDKQIAQTLLGSLQGVRKIENCLDVAPW